MIDFDRFVFFGETPTEWLQAHLYEAGVVHWYDIAFTLVYTSYFIVPFATAGRPLGARPARLPALRKRLVTLAIAGLATYIAFPAAPPWMAGEEGLLDGVHRTTGEGLGSDRPRHRGAVLPRPGGRSTWSPPCPRCTRPSSPSSPSSSGAGCGPGCGRCCSLYPLAMGLTLMATGEHYFFDVALGWLYAGGGDGRLGLVGTAPRAGRRRADSGSASADLSLSIASTGERVDAAGRGELAARPGRRASPPRSSRAVRVSPCGLDAQTTSMPASAIASAVSSKRRRTRGMLVGVLEHDRREPVALGHARPAADLVVVGLGQLGEEGLRLRVLVDLGLPAPRDRRRQLGAVDDRHAAGEGGRRSPPRCASQRLAPLLEHGGGGLDLGPEPRRDAGAAPRLRPRRRTCRRPRPAAARIPGRPTTGTSVLAGPVDELPAGAGDDPPGAELGRRRRSRRGSPRCPPE